jgi:hypothetical protein
LAVEFATYKKVPEGVIAAAAGFAPLLNGDPLIDDNTPVELLARKPNRLPPAVVLAVTNTKSDALAVLVAVLVGTGVVLDVTLDVGLEVALEVDLIPSKEISEP